MKTQKVKEIPVILSGVEGSGTWNGTDNSNDLVATGIYYYKLNIPNSPIMKMVLMK